MKNISEYFRNSIIASSQITIDYKKEKFYKINIDELNAGNLNEQASNSLWLKYINNDKLKKEKEFIDVIIALKTVKAKFLDSWKLENNIDELTSILFLPARIDKCGTLMIADDGKMPWIPREFLEPMIEPQLSIGKISTYDYFFESTTFERNSIKSWKSYFIYAKKLFEHVTQSDFSLDIIEYGDKLIETEGNVYIFEDTTVSATFHILNLYNHLLKNKKENLLYSKLTNGKRESKKELIKNTDIQKMIEHLGQMGGEYVLSPSQREAVNHFNNIGYGDILAVNGPPGTGKTTLLQSIVADMYVKKAIAEEKAPIIVASSTNNQAVTNIIDSFGKINKLGIKNLEKRWIKGVSSFATYFPSSSKISDAENKGYQYTNVNGEFFFEEVEKKGNKDASLNFFLKEFKIYFNINSNQIDLAYCKNTILRKLRKINLERTHCLSLMRRIKNIIKDEKYYEYINNLTKEISNNQQEINLLNQQISNIDKLTNRYLERLSSWQKSYKEISWYIKLLKFIPYFNNKLISWTYSFINRDELSFLNRKMSIDEIECAYYQKIDEFDIKSVELKSNLDKIKKYQGDLTKHKLSLQKIMEEFKYSFEEFNIYGIEIPDNEFWYDFDICEINNLLDRIRYVEFWMSVHYYECRWLHEKNDITVGQKHTTFENVLDIFYHRLAMISPCFVMTFYMLPKQFFAYGGNKDNHYYMYDYIDLLIIDESGQISPEIAAASFSLAKKALVVGDEKQIPPVWNTTKALDIAMAINKNVISNKLKFKLLEENGLNCSESSIMKVAALSCAYNKYDNGLFLCEHRRCYNEIIEYCNKLVYGGNLEPLRGSFFDIGNNNVLYNFLPPMGHKHIETEFSQRDGCSRKNNKEALYIIEWIRDNYLGIIEKYQKNYSDQNLDRKSILGIITPFKSQKKLILKLMKKKLPDYEKYIDVGTVHTFQGAERKIIIFSSVYGSKDGCYFINYNKSLMNVAVSRAKDSFLVFGDRNCLVGDLYSAASLLKEFTKQEISI